MNYQNLPLGIQGFEKIRQGGYLYVDKTSIISQLVSTGSYYFLSRPRRFGKSLLLSTLHAYFNGRKDLFEGLAIAEQEREWKQYPILHLDLNTEDYEKPDALRNKLDAVLCEWEQSYGSNPTEKSLPLRFEGIIKRACKITGERVVILVDEYDKPLLQTIGNEALQDDYRKMLKAFYGALKSDDQYIRFAFLTGVTKFGKVSIFSDLNNLTDLSMNWQYYNICGITNEELDGFFMPYIEQMAVQNQMSVDEVRNKLRSMYDGYHFTEESPGVYNPYSLLNTFYTMRFGSYWFETGTPSYLVELLKISNYNLERMANEQTTAEVLNSLDITSASPIPFIYQSGYLTIKGYDSRFKLYRLGFPNEELEEGFLKYLIPYYTPFNEVEAPFQIAQFVREVEAGETEKFLNRLKSFFADIPYDLVRDLENHYQNVLFILSKLLGFYVQAEYHTSEGRIDMVLKTADYVYVFEFKLDGTAEDAIRQINDKSYVLPFNPEDRHIVKIGLNFSTQTRNIEKWLVDS